VAILACSSDFANQGDRNEIIVGMEKTRQGKKKVKGKDVSTHKSCRNNNHFLERAGGIGSFLLCHSYRISELERKQGHHRPTSSPLR
jgi:hypothetical protein